MNNSLKLFACAGLTAAFLTGCGQSTDTTPAHNDNDGHTHATDETHDGHDHDGGETHEADDHDAQASLGSATIGAHQVQAWQGHGQAGPGKELHLSIKLTTDPGGTATVRAWIGSEDRLASVVGKGEFDADKGVYDVHAEAPTPLDANAKWWIEIEAEDGTKSLGSVPLHR